jgi:FAD-dependent oxidoreductase domain-containing protein 1
MDDAGGLGSCDMASIFEVVIAGGGVIGSAVAYFLAADPDFDGRVLVVEPDPGYTACSTTRSVGSIRQQFSTPENIRMSRFGFEFLKRAGETLEVDGEQPDVALNERGYLFLATEAGAATLKANHAVQTAEGADIALLGPEALAARFSWLTTEDIALGAVGLSGEGWFDPATLLHGFRRKARSLGAQFRRDRVVGLARDGNRITGAVLESGDTVGCGHVVNAAGPRAAMVAAMAGLALPVHPRKRMVYAFDCRVAVEDCPLLVDPSGVYVRPEGTLFIAGMSPPEAEDPDTLDLDEDYRWFDDVIWPRLAHRIPAFEAIKLSGAWAGHYAYNVFDQNAILGAHPEVSNLLFANGFSGHGVQQAPAVGRGIAELIVHGRYESLDLDRFGFARILQDRPIRELNVV